MRLDQLRVAAIKATDPAAYELESLRAEMQRSQREVGRLVRQQEALHGLLERREAEIRTVQCELAQVQQDWRDEVVLRVQREDDAVGSGRDRTSLSDEVAQLRADLEEATELRAHAERRCEDLEQRVKEMEEELAAREGDTPGALPLAALQERLVLLWEAGESQEAGRELSEAAQGRPVEELIELVKWLDERGDSARRNRLAEEVAHTRPVEVVAAFGTALMDIKPQRDPRRRRGTPSPLGCVVGGACGVMSPADLVTLHRCWEPDERPPGRVFHLRNEIPERLLSGARPADVAAEIFDLLGAGNESVLDAIARVRPLPLHVGMLMTLVPHLRKRGNTELARVCCHALARLSQTGVEAGRQSPPWGDIALAETDASQIHDFVLAAAGELSSKELAFVFMALAEPRSDFRSQREQAERFFQLCATELHASGRLTDVVTALDTIPFGRVRDGLPKRVREALLTHRP
ncbi:hypothetical protein [Streptomyces sp. BH055]|uniref:hypothetical protein n=1 Tax=Streptomyces sp. BH055 TaxID=3401173 RepID=UPI003BB5F2F8